VSQVVFRPAGARRFPTSYPRFAPWAVFLRRFAAGRGQRWHFLGRSRAGWDGKGWPEKQFSASRGKL